jgi:hypothetical protein
VFVGHAGDGTNRLFIVEQDGIIKVLQPGMSTPTVFLNVRTTVMTGGERGLLGLAFHPQYASNGRFFIFYTRRPDGALVVAEHRVSSNPDVANPSGTPLLTIPHDANSNHNGGMLSFGPDNFLYIGTGDGGSSNDPPNNAQNRNLLLGKILRIDVDRPAGGLRYSSPPDNPFVGVAGRDEIFAFGFRNPWRFSVDRLTGRLWVGDVGQGAREEVDSPIVNGGNYGWRVYEGTRCTGNDPSLCTPSNYIMPLFEYSHASGRCSLTGGYVYRGTLGAVASGTYVYGDFCTGEILAWNGAASVLLDTTMMISSFGEDEQGELYVVDLNGSVRRIVASGTTECTYRTSPTNVSFSFPASGGNGSIQVRAPAGCAWTAVSNRSWIVIRGSASKSGNGVAKYSVAPYTGTTNRTGTITIAGLRVSVTQTASSTSQ